MAPRISHGSDTAPRGRSGIEIYHFGCGGGWIPSAHNQNFAVVVHYRGPIVPIHVDTMISHHRPSPRPRSIEITCGRARSRLSPCRLAQDAYADRGPGRFARLSSYAKYCLRSERPAATDFLRGCYLCFLRLQAHLHFANVVFVGYQRPAFMSGMCVHVFENGS